MWNVPISMKFAHYLWAVLKKALVRYHGDWNVTPLPWPFRYASSCKFASCDEGKSGGKARCVGIVLRRTTINDHFLIQYDRFV